MSIAFDHLKSLSNSLIRIVTIKPLAYPLNESWISRCRFHYFLQELWWLQWISNEKRNKSKSNVFVFCYARKRECAVPRRSAINVRDQLLWCHYTFPSFSTVGLFDLWIPPGTPASSLSASLPSSSSSCSPSLEQNLPFSLSEGSHWLPYVCVLVCKSVSESAQPSLDDRGPRTIQTTRTPAFSPPPVQLRERNSPGKEQQKEPDRSKKKDFCTTQRRKRRSRGRVKVSERERGRGRDRERGSPSLMRKTSRYHMLCSMANTGCLLLSGSGMLTHSLQCPPAFLYLPEVRQSPSLRLALALPSSSSATCGWHVLALCSPPPPHVPPPSKPSAGVIPSLFPSFHSCCDFFAVSVLYTGFVPYTRQTFLHMLFFFLLK